MWPDQAGRDHCEMLVETLHVEHEIPTCAIQRYHEYESKISIEVYFKLLEADIEWDKTLWDNMTGWHAARSV